MIDIKRKTPRFKIVFTLSSNEIEGEGINMSQKGLGFLTEDELVPAKNIPFSLEVKGYIFSNRTYTIKGTANLKFSIMTNTHRDMYYNGFEFEELDKESADNLFALLEDIRQFERESKGGEYTKTFADFLYYPSNDLFLKARIFYSYYKNTMLKKSELFSTSLSSPNQSKVLLNNPNFTDKSMIMMGSNNYLGLTTHPDVIKAATQVLQKYGVGNGAGSMVGGRFTIHEELEERLATFMGKESALVFNSGYAANLGTLSGLLRPRDAVINDEFNHASIFDGCNLSHARVLMFKHNHLVSLERILKRAKLKYLGQLIVVDGIYSTDGSASSVSEIVKLSKKYEAKVMVDESHSIGVVGEKARGVSESQGVLNKVSIITATFSKSFGVAGGFVVGHKEIIEYLRFYANSNLFSTNIPPAVVGAVLKSIDIVEKDGSIREQLLGNIVFFKKYLEDLGINIGNPKGAIIPIFISNTEQLIRVSNKIFQAGIFHNVLTYPAVPMGGGLLRFGIMATHTKAQLIKALSIIENVLKEENII